MQEKPRRIGIRSAFLRIMSLNDISGISQRLMRGLFQGSARPPCIERFASKTPGAQNIAVLTAQIYDSHVIRKASRIMRKKQRCSLPFAFSASPEGSPREHSPCSNKDAATPVGGCCFPWEFIRDQAPQGFPGGWLCRHPLPGTTKIPSP